MCSPLIEGKVKMAHIWHVLGGSTVGGGTYVVRKIVDRLIRDGHHVTIVTSDLDTIALFKRAGAEIVDDIPIPRPISPVTDLKSLLRLAARMKTARCQLVHTHTSKAGIVGRFAAALAGVPATVHHVHGFGFDTRYSRRLELRLFSTVERAAAAVSDSLVFVNPEDLDLAHQLHIAGRERDTRVIPNGVDLPPLTNNADRQDSCMNIGFLGRLAAQKGIDVLIDAVADIPDHTELKVVLLGDGPLRETLESHAAGSRRPDRFEFAGHVTNADEWMDRFDMIVLPSRWEGHSISVLECMAHGRAVITTDIKGNRQTIADGENGLLVQPDDPEALRMAIERLIASPELRSKLGNAARSTVAERFQAEAMVDGVLSLYNDLGIKNNEAVLACAA